jgi:glutathione S-transferase
MSLTLHFHPLASYCHKVLIALYENDTPFTPNMVDLGNETERAALLKLWPIGKFPVLRDDARNETIPESTIIIEYLDRHYPGRTQFIPADAFSLADCAAAPALFYANEVMPLGEGHKNVAAYLDRLKARPCYARVLREAEPYFAMFPR